MAACSPYAFNGQTPIKLTNSSDEILYTFFPPGGWVLSEESAPGRYVFNPADSRFKPVIRMGTYGVFADAFGVFKNLDDFTPKFFEQETGSSAKWYAGLRSQTENFKWNSQRVSDITLKNGKVARVYREVIYATLLYGNKPITVDRHTAFIVNQGMNTVIIVQMQREYEEAINQPFYNDFVKAVRNISF